MKRDIELIKRNLEDKKNNDIIYKKHKLEEMFYKDPDLLEILGKKSKRPLNKYVDPQNPTKEELEERKQIEEYNKRIDLPQIIPYLKLNGIQKDTRNFIMFDIADRGTSYVNKVIKNQVLIVWCLVHEDNMDTEYEIPRTDLLSYIVKDLLSWSNFLGMQLMPGKDNPDIADGRYYCRTLEFSIEAPNHAHTGGTNIHDRIM